jgi:predicted transcriptional regulator of viral defense system
MTAPSNLSALLDEAERSGRLNLRTNDIRSALPRLSADALRQSLYRQQERGRLVRLSRGSDHWLIVPLQHSVSGAPPLEIWLDRYIGGTLGIPYYVALLSAAETYGVSPYGVMVTQVMVPERRRAISVGRHKVVFFVRASAARMPTRWHETPDGKFRVATPELTALELVERGSAVGGIARMREVVNALANSCTSQGMLESLDALNAIPTAQRLGALLALDGRRALAATVATWLRDKPTRVVTLGTGPAHDSSAEANTVFRVRLPGSMGSANA